MASFTVQTICRGLSVLSLQGSNNVKAKSFLNASTSTRSISSLTLNRSKFGREIVKNGGGEPTISAVSSLPRIYRTFFSTQSTFPSDKIVPNNSDNEGGASASSAPLYAAPGIIHTDDGRQFAAFDVRQHPKLKPSIVRRRLSRMRTYVGTEKKIRGSPWRLNLVCQLAAGLPLQEALTQLEFCDKRKAPLVQKVLKRTSNLADIRDGLQISQLEVAECFATRSTPLKRMAIMGRGRTGRMEHKHAHMRVVLREIDFKLRIYQAPTVNQKKKWFLLQQESEREYARVKAERDEIVRLEQQAAATAVKKEKEKKK